MNHDPTDLRGQQERREEEAEAARVRTLRDESDFRWLMRQPPFRRFMWKLLGDTGVFRLTFSQEATVMSFREGRRDVGLQQLEQIERLSPDDFDRMRREVREAREMKT